MNEKRIVTLKRTDHLPEATLGKIKIGWLEHSPIYTLENPKRNSHKDNRIPAGKYKCVPYSGTKYKNVYMVENVPGRSAILIHWGNTEKDTEGCILIGKKKSHIGPLPAVLESRICYDMFRDLIGPEAFYLIIED